MAKPGHYLVFSMLKGAPAWKKSTPPPVVAVVTDISYVYLFSVWQKPIQRQGHGDCDDHDTINVVTASSVCLSGPRIRLLPSLLLLQPIKYCHHHHHHHDHHHHDHHFNYTLTLCSLLVFLTSSVFATCLLFFSCVKFFSPLSSLLSITFGKLLDSSVKRVGWPCWPSAVTQVRDDQLSDTQSDMSHSDTVARITQSHASER